MTIVGLACEPRDHMEFIWGLKGGNEQVEGNGDYKGYHHSTTQQHQIQSVLAPISVELRTMKVPYNLLEFLESDWLVGWVDGASRYSKATSFRL